ncbi:MAG: sterol desaturase family protein [Myxococcota bacterium]|nr:sterol desaturase family protein [Myxococcota bacterium]
MNAIAIVVAIPVFFALIGIELAVSLRSGRRLYRFHDAITSLDCGVVQQATAVFLRGAIIGAYVWLHERFAVLEISAESVLAWVVLFFGVDLAYYWFHRASHRVNAIWATHVVHHQSEEYNLTTALRQSALQGAAAAAFYWPLAIAGFPPAMFVAMSTANTLYQFWIHTRLIRRLPRPLELVLNTPSHHRVHHGIDPAYIDKNYGGILIVWDRVFGTFAAEGREEPSYGTVKPLSSWSPIWANFEVWARLWEVSKRTRRWRDKVWIWLAPPEWLPDDHGGVVTIPEVDREARVLYETPSVRALHGYVALQFALLGGATAVLLVISESGSALELGALASWIVASTAAWGALFESERWGRALEIARVLAMPLLVGWLSGAAWAAVPAALVALGSLAWLGRIPRDTAAARA